MRHVDYEDNTFEEFVKFNGLRFYIARDQLNIIIDNYNSNVIDIIIQIYNKFKSKEYAYLDEFIQYLYQRLNIIKKEVKK